MNSTTAIKPLALWAGVALLTILPTTQAATDSSGLEEVVVTSQLQQATQLNSAISVSVFDASAIAARGADNLEQLLNLAPNVNFSSGASRGRFVQIRGIGERSQFIDPVNPSVGLVIDGIDFTGLGLAASTLDIEQVEILRGPQGTVYGANALAGLIAMRSHAPASETSTKFSADVGDYHSTTFTAVTSGPVSEQLGYRLAARRQQSDGYTTNRHLNREDTNNIDESVFRGKLSYRASDHLQLDTALFYLDADNGYDAFSLYNTRETQSDQPGHDRQQTLAGAITAHWDGNPLFQLQSTVSGARSETEYGYDEDWSFVGFHPWEYSSRDNYLRERDNLSADLRLLSTSESRLLGGSTDWVAGVYLRSEQEELLRNGSFRSVFDTQNLAVYGQLRTQLSERLALVSGLRLERRDADYADAVAVRDDSGEDLWGGNLTLEFSANDSSLIYATVSRGYKAGGINGRIISAAQENPNIDSETFQFDTESLLNYEVGLKGSWLQQRLQAQVAVFYQDRRDVQAKQSIFNPVDFSFDDFLANAAGGRNRGIEFELNYFASERLRLFASAGLLNAEFEKFVSDAHVDARDDFTGEVLPAVDLNGRELAHAPGYQFFSGVEFLFTGDLSLRLEVEGKDAFYFSNSHSEKSRAYELLNARLGYNSSTNGHDWTLAVWGKNLTNETYSTRGFYFSNQFGNNPANGYAPEAYYQFGAPRTAGISASYAF